MDNKRRKLHHIEVMDKKTSFLSMNSDCIDKIFEWLELNDICSMSETCKQLKILTSDYFQRKYKNKLSRGMHIIAVKGIIELRPNERYVKSFSRCFDSVIVNVDARVCTNINLSKTDLPLFIRENCGEYMSSIRFQTMFLSQTFGNSIMSVLKNVETVVFSDCDIEGTYHQILKYCPNLKYLTVEEMYGNKIEQLLLETFPKLEHFDCVYYGRVSITDNLKIFLRKHQNLKRLTWCFHDRIVESTHSDKTIECIEMMVENVKNLEELFLSFDGKYNLASICDKLKILSDNENFKRLELDFRFTKPGYEVSGVMLEQGQLTTLKSLLGLHLCDFLCYGNNFLPTLSTLKDLRILQLDSVSSIRRLNNIPLDGLSSLQELHIGTLMDVKFIQKFICQVKNLKIISVLRREFSIAKLDLPMLGIERKKLGLGVQQVVIYVNVESKKIIVYELSYADLVKVKFVDFVMNPYKIVGTVKPFVRPHQYIRES